MTSNITIDSTDAIILELFKYINNVRQSNNMNLFSHDYLSEYILSNLFRLKKGPPSNNEIDAKFVSQGCVFLDKLIYPISTQINNEPNYQLYFSIIQQELNNNKNSPLLSNGIYSHMGLYVKNIDINFYIIFIFSTKIASYDEVIGCNDGNILIGSILKADHFIEGALVKEITGIKGTSFGPKNIRYNNETKKFYICLLNSINSSINNSKKLIKTVYQTNLNNIPYGAANALGRNVDFRGGNVAENQIVSFINGEKSQTYNGNVMDYMANLGFPVSNSVGSGTKNKLDIKSKILAYNQNKNLENNNNNNKFNCVVLTPKKKNSTGLSTIAEDNNDLNKSFIRNSMPKFEGISPIATKSLSPCNYNNKNPTSDLITTINGVHISPMKKNDFNNVQNPFETKSKIMNDNNIISNNNIITNNNINNNLSKSNFNNQNLNNFSFINPINNENNNNINNQINNNNINNNGVLSKTNNLFNTWNLNQNSNNTLNNNLTNNNPNSLSNTLGNPFNNSKQNTINFQ